jgi:hypothetical protein
MCFSATASFTTSAVLFPLGFYAAHFAKKYRPNYIYLSLIPIFFAIQQLFEGLVWLGIDKQKNSSIQFYALVYLLFAYAFWPSYIAFSIQKTETALFKRKVLQSLTLIGLVLALAIYLPILINSQLLKVYLINQSICYDFYFTSTQLMIYNFFYLGILLFSCAYATNKKINYYGLLILFSYILAGIWYRQTFTSVWCFFAAILSLMILWLIKTLPKETDEK